MRRAQQGPGVPWRTQIRGLGIGWALAIPISGYWVGGEVVPTQYSPPGTHPVYHPPSTQPAAHHRCTALPLTAVPVLPHGHAHMTVLRGPKEILGVNNAHVYRSVLAMPPYACPAASLSPPVGPAVA